ncbi:MAG: N-formylglutamate deformylase [Gemmatimonadaceae bacterium]|nr:N-formylglutamate deformylase [Gemmatimonadaceae bacterium]
MTTEVGIDTFTLHRGHSPLLISIPHVGTAIPADQRYRYTERAQDVEDTDWFLDRLYAFAADLGATFIVPRFSRYLIDLNRSSDNAPMYPGRNNTELCPTRHFSGDVLYRDGLAPDAVEVERRVAEYWQPYHDALHDELARLRQAHGHAVLFDAHSIKSELPWLFDGQLPHMSVGTANGASCAPSLSDAVMRVFAAQSDFSHVLDGRFKGGHITRHFGNPGEGIHAMQLEMCWRAYMEETPPYEWHDTQAAGVTPLLRTVVESLLRWAP